MNTDSMKIIKVSACCECLFCTMNMEYSGYYCKLKNKSTVTFVAPDWCPLKNESVIIKWHESDNSRK